MTLEQLLETIEQHKTTTAIIKAQNPALRNLQWEINDISLDVIMQLSKHLKYNFFKCGDGVCVICYYEGTSYTAVQSVPCETRLVAEIVK